MIMPKPIHFQAKSLTVVNTVFVFLLCAAAVGGVAWFTRFALKTSDVPTKETSTSRIESESINLDLLSEIEERMEEKMARPIPESAGLRDPYRSAPVPQPPPPPAEQPAQ